MKKALLVVLALFLVIFATWYYVLRGTGIDAISIAQTTGDFSICERAGNYRYRCIAETELQQKLSVRYDCTNTCNQPQCVSYIGCGSGGDEAVTGCPMAQLCIVDQSWLCTETGGLLKGTTTEAQRIHGGNCECPSGNKYISGYGCAECGVFARDETRQYCMDADRFSGGHFQAVPIE